MMSRIRSRIWRQRKVESIWYITVAVLSWLLPRRSSTIPFASLQYNGQFTGNLRSVFERAIEDDSLGSCVWIAHSSQTHKVLRDNELPVHYGWLRTAVTVARAEYVFVDSVRSPLGLSNLRFVQLWHGTGFKQIGIENSNRGPLGRYLVSRFGRRTIFLLATSEADAERKATSLCTDKVFITGSPRNDSLLNRASEREGVGEQTILYAPTFRDGGWRKQPLSPSFWGRMAKELTHRNLRLLVKRHPSDKTLVVPDAYDRIIDVTDEVEDVQSLLAEADVLITDYSGIVSDYVLTSRPVVWFVPDLDEYDLVHRGFYYDVPDIFPGPIVKNEEELLRRLCDLEWFKDDDYQVAYRKFVSMFHRYHDSDSTRRVIDAVSRAISGSHV